MPLLFPLIWFFSEVAMLIIIGQAIGVGLTILEMVFSALFGIWLIRSTVRRMRSQSGKGAIPNILGGVLLIIPGFITDIFGIIALLPGAFNFVANILSFGQKVNIHTFMKSKIDETQGFKKNTYEKNPFNHRQTEDNHRHSNMEGTSKKNTTIIDGEVARKYERKK